MQKQYRISAGQLFSILFVNRSVIMLTHNTLLGGGENMVDNILSALLALVLNFVLILPLYFLHRRNPQENVLETGERLVGKPGAILLAVFYGLYFMAIDSYYLSFFQIFLNNIMEPLMPVWLVALAFVAVVCYAAYLGIEAIARTAGFALAILLIGMVWIGVALLPKIQWINYDPFLYNGPKQLFTGTALFLARSTGFSTMALLLPRVSGKKKLKFCIWNTGIYCLMIFLIGMVWIGVALLPKIQWINYDPFLYNGPKQLFTGTALFLARSTGFSTMALLLPRVSGKKKLKFCIWNTGIYCLMIFLLLGMVGVGGSYLKNQLFPVYTAASLADVGVLERLDVVFITIWVAGPFIQMSTDTYLFMTCLRKVANKKTSRIALPVASLLVAALAVAVTYSLPLQKVFYGVPLLFTITITAAVGIPLVLLIVDLIRKTKRVPEKAQKGEGSA